MTGIKAAVLTPNSRLAAAGRVLERAQGPSAISQEA
jgi:hypothetical protein